MLICMLNNVLDMNRNVLLTISICRCFVCVLDWFKVHTPKYFLELFSILSCSSLPGHYVLTRCSGNNYSVNTDSATINSIYSRLHPAVLEI
jgi:hypothetical protein